MGVIEIPAISSIYYGESTAVLEATQIIVKTPARGFVRAGITLKKPYQIITLTNLSAYSFSSVFFYINISLFRCNKKNKTPFKRVFKPKINRFDTNRFDTIRIYLKPFLNHFYSAIL